MRAIAQLSRAFGMRLVESKSPDGVFRTRTGPVHVPVELAHAVEAVFGFDNRPAAWPRFRLRLAQVPSFATSPDLYTFTAAQVARLYGFSSAPSAIGQRIAIVELGGGFSRTDVSRHCARIGR